MNIKLIPIKDINPAEYNPRIITKEEFNGLVESIKTFGQLENLIVNKDMTLISGHQRLNAMQQLGFPNATCAVVDLNKRQEKKLNVLMNSQAISGTFDDIKLSEILEELKLDDDYESLRLDKLEPLDLSPTEIEEDEAPEVSSEPPVSQLGEIYQLGRHRVMCGDSTDFGQVSDLLDGAEIDLVYTDPPYGVSIKGKFTGSIKNDELNGKELVSFLSKAFEVAKTICVGSIYYSYEILNQQEFFEAYGSKPTEIIIWVKDSASFYSDNKFNRRFEPIAYYSNGVKLTNKAETNVWEFAKSSSFNSRDENGLRFNEDGNFLVAHPTTKPVGLISKIILSQPCTNLLDLFLGSGSTLIACEQTERTCYGMELDPKCVDVIRKRYWKFVNGSEEGWEDGTTKCND